ncbi:nuclear transport factor 2 family protein [Isoptericola sp. NPDC056134]|uniref:nuclear transport factor 2 family protein n=1 Tax=unclassified Isoptericola TaxID=2623355 RepID=UPI0035E9D781
MSLTTEDRLAIHELLSLHGHLVDAGRLGDEDLGRLFVPAVRYDTSALGGPVLEGIAAVREAAYELGEGNPVAHLVTNVVVAVGETDGTATAMSKGLGVTASGAVGAVTYDDSLVRTPAGWRVSARRITPSRRPGAAGS